MKRFTQKFFLLAIGMILSVGAYAQDAITHHWPEVRFTIVNADGTPTDGLMYHVPGWDAWLRYKSLTNTELIVNGHIRVQRYENTGGLNYKARLVTRYAISSDNRLKVPELKNSATTSPLWVKINGEGEVKNIRGLQYKDVFGTDKGPDGTNYKVDIIDESTLNVSTTYKDADNKEYFKIPTSMTHTASSEVYTIDEIGDYALRQYSRGAAAGSSDKNFVRVGRIIIPKEITKIGRGAFFMNYHTKEVVFEDGCPVNEILEFNFQDWTSLETITFSANVSKLWGTVLGGCPALNKITFKNATPPTLTPFEWNEVNRMVFETTTEQGPTLPEKCIIEVPLHSAKTYVDSNDKFKEFPMSSKFTMNKDYISYCSDLPFTFKQYDTASKTWNEGNVKAYYVTDSDVKLSEGKIDITEIAATKIPSEIVQGITPLDSYNDETGFETGYFGVILSGTAGETYDIFYPNNLPCDEISINPHENLLQGVINQAYIGVTNDYLFFVLTNGKFLTVESPGNLAAHKVFLFYSGDQTMPFGARELSISLPEETGIINHEVNRVQNDVFYNLQGIQVQQPSKGIFIKNGKKFVIK